MAYRWKDKKILQDTIIDAKKVDQAFNNYVGVINGGIDRENIPINAIGTSEARTACFGKMEMTDNLNADVDDISFDSNYTGTDSPASIRVAGFRYGEPPLNEGGTWIEAGSDNIDCQEGMLSIHWRCNSYIPKYFNYYINYGAAASNVGAQKGVSWKIEVDGIEVYRTSYVMPTHWTHTLAVNVPVPAGPREVKVYWTVPTRKNDQDAQAIFYWYGGQITLHNRYR